MFHHQKPAITELGNLLSELNCDEWGSRKTAAVITCFQPDKITVKVGYDDGKGHSGAFSADFIELAPAVFQEAQEKGFVTGKLELGYVSKIEFVLTPNETVRQEAYRIGREWKKREDELMRHVYRLTEEIPTRFRGIHFEQACLEGGRTQMDFVVRWMEEGDKVMERLLADPNARYFFSSRKSIPKDEKSQEIAAIAMATLVQWLGTKEGVAFFTGVVTSVTAKKPEGNPVERPQ